MMYPKNKPPIYGMRHYDVSLFYWFGMDKRYSHNVGKRFGKLTVIALSDKRGSRGSKHTVPLWECRCDCGATVFRAMDSLTNGYQCSCPKCAGLSNGQNVAKHAGYIGNSQVSKLRETRINSNNTSGHKGVSQCKKTGHWVASLKFQGRSIHLGTFKTIEEAVAAREKGEAKYFRPLIDEAKRMEENQYSKEEQLEIGRKIIDKEISMAKATEIYGISLNNARQYMNLYDVNSHLKGQNATDKTAIDEDILAYMKYTKTELIGEVIKYKYTV